MLSEQEQDNVLHPFQILASKFASELQAAKETFSDWGKARSIKASNNDIADNNELSAKVTQFEKGKNEIDEFIAALTLRLKSTNDEPAEITVALEQDLVRYESTFTTAGALNNHKYTVEQRNEINRRVTAINSSRMLNNSDMEALQRQWTTIRGMKNDRRLDEPKRLFEARLTDWEKLISQKKLSKVVF